jgi:transposase
MSKEIFYIGVDVGQEELWVAIEGVKVHSFRHTVSGIKSMWEWVRNNRAEGVLHFCMEATGVYSLKLATGLSIYPDTQVSIVNPAQISSFAKALLRRSKTDRVDAQVILAFAQSQHPQVWEPPPQVLQQLYELVVQLEALKATQRQWANRKHTQAYTPNLPSIVSKTTKALQKSLEKKIAQVKKAILTLCEADPFLKAQMKLLCTIPGIKEQSASRLLAYGKTALTNYSAKALTAHSGLAPSHKQSGTSLKAKSHLAKLGDKRLRGALYMPALVGIRYNPILQQYYQKLVAKGKPKMLALVACMKKLLLIIRAILINQTTFNPNIHAFIFKNS